MVPDKEHMRQGGHIAVTEGKRNEQALRDALNHEGYAELTPLQRTMLKSSLTYGIDPAEHFKHAKLLRHYVLRIRLFSNIYALPWESDAFVYNDNCWRQGLVVEVKSQTIGGSVDEKLPFVMLSLEALDRPSVLIISGDGFRPGAIVWAEQFAELATAARKIRVLRTESYREFRQLIRDGHAPQIPRTIHKQSAQGALL